MPSMAEAGGACVTALAQQCVLSAEVVTAGRRAAWDNSPPIHKGGDVVGFLLDLRSKELSIWVNGALDAVTLLPPPCRFRHTASGRGEAPHSGQCHAAAQHAASRDASPARDGARPQGAAHVRWRTMNTEWSAERDSDPPH
eukprot:gene13586-37466_t